MSDTDVMIVGGGPAGMVAGLLFARAGVRTLVLEKHRDFLRDFRGDTVHPSTLDLFDELGLLDRLLAVPHDRVTSVGAVMGGRQFTVGNFAGLPRPGNFIALMPQWDFLDFVAAEAGRYPAFALRMEAEAVGLIECNDRITGVSLADGERITARLTIAADGRSSAMRAAADLPLHDLGAPIDVFWFRVPKARTPANTTNGYIGGGEMIVTIDRGDYYQCARVIAKGGADAVGALGLAVFREQVAAAAPALGGAASAIASWDDVKLLTVSLDRLTRWSRPGLLAIGDAAHAMSPVGGVGINLAIQDAVAAANVLAEPLSRGADIDPLLPKVQARRMLPVKVIQAIQRLAHRNVLAPALAGRASEPPWLLKLLDRSALLQQIPARILGLGIRREHVRSPEARPS